MPRVLRCLAILLVATLSLPVVAASTSNLKREKTYADQIEKYLVIGDAIRLEARGVKFLAIDTRPEKSPAKGAVILLHGRGVHPAWGFVDKLRMDLAQKDDWHTLSIQLPILETDATDARYSATLPEAFERIDAAISYLRKNGIKRIVLQGHSISATTAVYYVTQRPANTVQGVVLLGMGPGSGSYNQTASTAAALRLPVFDAYGTRDFDAVLKEIPVRQKAVAASGNRHYQMTRIAGANHFYADRYPELRSAILKWLATLK